MSHVDHDELRRLARMARRMPLAAPYTPENLVREVAARLHGTLQAGPQGKWRQHIDGRWVTLRDSIGDARALGLVAHTMRAMYDEIVARPDTTFDRSVAAEVLLAQATIHRTTAAIRLLLPRVES